MYLGSLLVACIHIILYNPLWTLACFNSRFHSTLSPPVLSLCSVVLGTPPPDHPVRSLAFSTFIAHNPLLKHLFCRSCFLLPFHVTDHISLFTLINCGISGCPKIRLNSALWRLSQMPTQAPPPVFIHC